MPQTPGKKVGIWSDLCGFGTGNVNLLTIILIGKICRLAHTTCIPTGILLSIPQALD
jgi:hypothetical protein